MHDPQEPPNIDAGNKQSKANFPQHIGPHSLNKMHVELMPSFFPVMYCNLLYVASDNVVDVNMH